ncbi:hypothetical protein ATCC90586_007867 [Pythium insidiosum]|nr:hypothetical protein ATCC90586_007867 [Pythium insidiosum]
MAHRDLTARFAERRANLKKRNLRFKLHQLKEKAPSLALFPSRSLKVKGLESALLQEARELSALEEGEVLQPEWIRFADDANEATRLLQVKLEYLQLVHTRRLMIRFNDSEEQYEREIDQLNDEITALFQRADRALKKITSPFVGGEPSVSPADRLVRLNTQRAVAGRLQTLSVTFRQRQREYLHRLQLQKYGSDVFNFDGDDTMNEECGPTDPQLHAAIELQRFKIDSRDAEIQRIARSVAQLAIIFKEVAGMVIDQGTLVDRIDYNMEQVASRMRSGLQHLRDAERYDRNTRPQRCIFLLVTLIMICFCILVVKHS